MRIEAALNYNRGPRLGALIAHRPALMRNLSPRLGAYKPAATERSALEQVGPLAIVASLARSVRPRRAAVSWPVGWQSNGGG